MSIKLSEIRKISVIYFYFASNLLFSDAKSSWVYKNDVEVKLCYNPNDNLGFCVPVKECATFNNILRHGFKEKFQFFFASRCERKTGDPPFICCTNDTQFKDKKVKVNQNDRIIFPDELERVKKAIEINGKSPVVSTQGTVLKKIETTETPTYTTSEKSTTPKESSISNDVEVNKNTQCGGIAIANKIYGGQDADLSEFSWMVIFEYRNLTTGKLLMDCAGSLINDRYVITAAHCVQGDILRNKGKLESVRVGEHDTDNEIDCNETGCRQSFQRVAVDAIIPHKDFRVKNYDGTRNLHDIALVRLKKAVKFNELLQPVCLPSVAPFEEFDESTKFVVAGWGHNGTMLRTAIKQKLEIPFVKHEKCRQMYGKKFYLADEQLCAGGRFREDSCNGDSGGPLMRINKDFWVLEGIVSFGLKCGLEQPGVYTNVRHYLEWIKENMKH